MTLTLTKAVADFSKQLAESASIGAVTSSLNNGLDSDGVQITNQKIYGFTVDSGSRKEYIVAYFDNNNQLSQIVSISRQGVATTGFAKGHNVGASVQITDWALLLRITNMLNGTTDWDAGVPIKYDATPSQVNPLALATVQFVLDTASGSTVLAFNPQTVNGVVGEGVTSGDWVYLKESDGKWYRTDADAVATSVDVKVGKVRATTLINQSVAGGIFISGTETVGTYVAGTIYYISNTAGALSTSAGTNSVVVGVGDANTDLFFSQPLKPIPNASTTVRGFAEQATDAEVLARTSTGATGAPLFVNPSSLSSLVKFGGTGADGALTISSGTTTLDLAGAIMFTRNYSSISITGTGVLAFSNPHANGTTITLKSQGNVTITSSTNPAINLRSLGGTGGTAGADGEGSGGIGSIGNSYINSANPGTGGATGAGGIAGAAFSPTYLNNIQDKNIKYHTGSGGGGGKGGSSTGGPRVGGAGGRGGGSLYIEVGGALNITSTINASGADGGVGSAAAFQRYGGSGGGGGGGGKIIILHNTLTANSGTYTVTGGAGGGGGGGGSGVGSSVDNSRGGGGGAGYSAGTNGGINSGYDGGAGGAGGAGLSLVAPNTEFS